MVLPRQNSCVLWEEVSAHSAHREVAGESGVDCSFPGKRQTYLWDCLCSRMWVYLVGNTGGWGDTVCALKFNVGGKIMCVVGSDVAGKS